MISLAYVHQISWTREHIYAFIVGLLTYSMPTVIHRWMDGWMDGWVGGWVGGCDVYVGGKVRVSEFMIFLALQHCGSK